MYSDQKFYSRVLIPAGFALSFGTATNATSVAAATTGVLTKFKRKISISAIRLRCTTIPNASATVLKASFLNGTSTFGTAVLTTATATTGGQWLDGVITSAANAVLAADTQPTITSSGTFTASGDAIGSYDVYFEVTEQFS